MQGAIRHTKGPPRVVDGFADLVVRSERRLVVTIASGLDSLADIGQGA